jgi:hypothetical protein
MIEISDVDTHPPKRPGWYTYTFKNGFTCTLRYDGNRWCTAGGQMHRIMPGDTWHVLRVPPSKFKSMVEQILATSKSINDGRERLDVLAKAGEEMGELAQEVLISLGKHYKQPGPDGVVGEAIDVIVCMVDMIYGVYPDITEQILQEILEKKLTKWKTSQEKKNVDQKDSDSV